VSDRTRDTNADAGGDGTANARSGADGDEGGGGAGGERAGRDVEATDDAGALEFPGDAPAGRVEAVFVAEEDSAPMERLERVRAVEGGLEGDRYLTGRGYYSPFDVCEVTLVAAEALAEVRERYDLDLSDGRHRRNVVTRGVDVHDLLETTFRVGGAVLRGTRPRPPCAHVGAVAGDRDVTRALREGRGGICADVLEAGEIRVGDAVSVLESDPRSIGRRIADRLRSAVGERS
jgi:MOSC domain-containing protein YiiM